MADITLKDIGKVYPGDVTAVRDFSLEINDKEFVILVGPSGCGKSTTLRMIAGLEAITSGELQIGGRVMNNVHSKDRNIAMVFQNYALYPHMTVYKNMAFALKLRKTPKDEIDRRVREAARILGIEHLLNRRPKALSGGERQRVALGRAMVRNPAVFLLDEPLSNLDAKLRASMRTELIKLHKRLDATFVYVTHDQTEAMTMGDRIVVMKDGLIQQVGAPQQLYDSPNSVFVAGFIGSPQMNFIKGRLEAAGGDYYVHINGDVLRIDPARATGRIADYADRDVVIGIRPEDLRDGEGLQNGHPGGTVSTVLDVCEPMGSEVYLYLDYGENRLTARVPPGVLYKPGDRLEMALDMTRLHLFDPDTEAAIL